MTPPPAAAASAVARRAPRAAPPRPPSRPRRVSGPARAPRVAAGRAPLAQRGLAVGALAAVRGLSRRRLLDRLISGRAWIALVAFALIGIVTLQLGLLELNANVGRALEREAALQRENATLAIENSELAAGGRVESQASKLGMGLVPLASLRFLKVDPGVDADRAAAALSAPVKASVAPAEAQAGAQGDTPAGEQGDAPAGEQAGAQGAEQTGTQGAAPGSEQAVAAGGGGSSSGPSTAAAGPSEATPAGGGSSSGPSTAAAGPSEATPAGGAQAGATG